MLMPNAMPAQDTIKPSPAVALTPNVTCNTSKDRKKPNAYADISKKPVHTVSSWGKVSSAVKSMLTGITGTRQHAPKIMFIEISTML